MLVLQRRSSESIVIGNDVVVTIVEISGDKVRLGFVGPAEVAIDRLEVRQAKNESKAKADDKECPHPKGSSDGAQWRAGWDGAKEAAEKSEGQSAE